MATIQTKITAATVYPDRARLTRSGTLQVDAGSQVLEVSNLPRHLNPDSVRAAAHGSARSRLHGIQVQLVNYSETPQEAVRQLEQEIEELQDQIQRLATQQELIRQQRAYLDSLAMQSQTYATALAAGETTLEQQLALFAALRRQAGELEEEAQERAGEKRLLERRWKKLKNDLDQHQNARPLQRYSALVEVEVLSPGELTLELVYVLAGVYWKPLYDLRLVEAEAEPVVELTYLGQVNQNSGEDWQDISLTLSTARPALTSRPPELQPWFITPALPPVAPSAASRGPAREARLMAAEAAPASLPPQFLAEAVVAEVETTAASVVYRIPGRLTIPGDGDPHRVTVAEFRLPPELDYLAAPRLVESVYRRATLRNDSPYTLLPGQLSIFAGEEFLGNVHLDLTPPQGELEVFLGTEDRIRIERELKRREVDKSFVGGRRRIHYVYTIEIENLLSAPVKLVLHDQIPVSRHEDLKVKLDQSEPRPTEQSGLNLLEWKLELKPKEKRLVQFNFSVEHPQAMQILNLP